MSDSEFEFEDDDCDVYDAEVGEVQTGIEGSKQNVTEKLMVENAYYEAEDAMTHVPAKAVELFLNLYKLIEEMQEGSPSNNAEHMLQWRIKVLQHLIKLPGPDVASRCRYFTDLLASIEKVGMSIDSGSVILGSLDAIDHRLGDINEEAKVMIDMYMAASQCAAKLGNISALHSMTLRLGYFLLRLGDLERLEEWLKSAYYAWMCQQAASKTSPVLEGWRRDEVKDIFTSPTLYAAVNQSPSEDSHILGILALDLDFCRQVGDDLRPTRLMPKYKNFARALVDRRTLALLRENIGKFEFRRGVFDEAYRAFYDTWECSFSMGNTRHACKLLLRLVLCNILSGSDIDPLSTREAQTLLGQHCDGSFMQQIEYLRSVSRAINARDVKETKSLLDSKDHWNAIDADRFLVDSEIKDELLLKVRKSKFDECCSSRAEMKVEWLRRELEFSDDDDLKCFTIQMFSDSVASPHSGTIIDDSVYVTRKDSRLLCLNAILDICDDLLKKAQSVNMEMV